MNTQELYNILHEYFEYREGFLIYKKQVGKRGKIGNRSGTLHNSGYWAIQVKGKYYRAHRLVFLYHYGFLPKTIDHIDRNKLNNNIENLREVTDSENKYNSAKYKNNTSGYKGVCYSKQKKKWRAQINFKGKRLQLGLFPTPEMAYFAYCEFVRANLPVYYLEEIKNNGQTV